MSGSLHRTLRHVGVAGATTMALLVGASLIAPTAAHAQPSSNQATAEEAYTKGDTAYNLGRFDEAADWFTKAYEAWPQPEFLYNIAQSYRLGGNCKQALHFYKRFKSLKEKDRANPLAAKKKAEIDKFIADLEACAKTTADVGTQQPDGIDRPDGGGGDPDGEPDTDPVTTPDPDADVAVVVPDGDDEDDEDLEIEDGASPAGPKLVSARLSGGIAKISAGELPVPPQASFFLTAGYPVAAGPVNLDLGLGLGFATVNYRAMEVSESGSLLSVLANAGATYPVTEQIGVRGDLGIGLMSFGGLVQGNPFTVGGAAASGGLTMLNVRVAIAADYAITENIVATLTPLAFAYSPAKEGLDMDSVTRFDFMIGVGYRM